MLKNRGRRRAARKRHTPPCASSEAKGCSFSLCSLLSTAWIVIALLSLIFIHIVGFQGVHSSTLSWSMPWLKAVKADKNSDLKKQDVSEASNAGHEDSNVALHEDSNAALINELANVGHHSDVDKNVQMHRSSLGVPSQRKLTCSLCFSNALLYITSPVCLEGSQGKHYARGSRKDHGHHSNDIAREDDGFIDINIRVQDTVESSPAADEHGNESLDHRMVDNEGLTDTENVSTSVPVSNTADVAATTKVELETSNTSWIPSLNISEIRVRQEPGDGPYNYASESKGAKVLATNKETKGASSILNKDKDKYLRTPCSAENKYVDLELSEETLVVTLDIANYEFYSSNVKEFELWGSSIYPSDNWTFIGKFEAENSRVLQTFQLVEPKWVRYLRFRILSHYGSDFYCTLSVLQVYGVDAIEWMLEDWIAEEAGTGSRIPPPRSTPLEENSSRENLGLVSTAGSEKVSISEGHDSQSASSLEDEGEFLEASGKPESYNLREVSKAQQGSRPALDSVMKLMMQKVRTLEHNQPLFSQHLKELHAKYKEVLTGHEKSLARITNKLDNAENRISSLTDSLNTMEQSCSQERRLFQTTLTNQINFWNTDLNSIRNELRSMENKEMVAFAVSVLSIVAVLVVEILKMFLSLFHIFRQKETSQSCGQALRVIQLSCSLLVAFVLSL